jgi:FlaA1/EpsC-like NDP-sugar epimerase
VARDLAGSVVLITGGAGSVGSELARQIARVEPARLILVEQAESPLYFVHLELERTHPLVETIPIVADITNRDALTRIFEKYRPDHVYHAAAYKHVPMMEANAAEAVRNNVLGTLQVAECAARTGASKFVLISTDKAVRPSSVMGATKRVAERIVLGWPTLRASRTEFRAVRFGNVLGSEGSVVPLFRRQLARGGPLTVTHPDVRRLCCMRLLCPMLPGASPCSTWASRSRSSTWRRTWFACRGWSRTETYRSRSPGCGQVRSCTRS